MFDNVSSFQRVGVRNGAQHDHGLVGVGVGAGVGAGVGVGAAVVAKLASTSSTVSAFSAVLLAAHPIACARGHRKCAAFLFDGG